MTLVGVFTYSPGVIEASVHGEKPYPRICDPVAQNTVDLKELTFKKSPILRCACRAYGMNGSG